MNYLSKNPGSIGVLALMALLLFACQDNADPKEISVRNRLDLDRERETVSIQIDKISTLAGKYGAENLLISDAESGEVLLSQAIDNDMDGSIDEILFQTDIRANATKKFIIDRPEEGAVPPDSEASTYSRFVPERIDDYAWENDRVAFRTYGPEAQRITESGAPGGTLTSGMDGWLKRVHYPVIDKWYAADQEDPGAYHRDSGEGYDPYHVGGGRGIGGIGVWSNDSLYVSGNFTDYKTIATGPIRTVFELTYAPWEANGSTIREKKKISLDLGSNLSRFEVELESGEAVPNFAIGLSLHDKEGEVKAAPEEGWFRYWEPMEDSELGVAVVLDPKLVQNYIDHRVATPDQSHLLILAEAEQPVLSYYAGFGWKKSGQFSSAEQWDRYLQDFSRRLASPLEVEVE